MASYKIVEVERKTVASIESELNALAKNGYVYVTHLKNEEKHLILMEKS